MKNLIQMLTNQFYYFGGKMRLVFPALFGPSEIILNVDKEQAAEFQTKIQNKNLTLEDFLPFMEESPNVARLFKMVKLNKLFEKLDGRFKLVVEGMDIFLHVNGERVPISIPDGLWEKMLQEMEADNQRNLLAYIRFFANVQQNPFLPVRNSVMNFLRMKGEQYLIGENGVMYAFKQLKKLSDQNVIYQDATNSLDIVRNKIKKSPAKVNMFYLNGKAQLTEGTFENISNHYGSNHTVQWIGTVEYALSLNPNLPTYTDGWTGNMRIVKGLRVEEPKAHVVTDPNMACVKGLHIYPLNWNNYTYYNHSSSELFLITVHPKEISAIPNRENYDKSRVYAYTVVEKLEKDNEGNIVIPDSYKTGIVYGDNVDFDQEFTFPALEDDASTEYILPTQRFDIEWDYDDDDYDDDDYDDDDYDDDDDY